MNAKKYQQPNNVKVLVQVGNLGASVIDHLITPLAQCTNVREVLIFCHHPGPLISRVKYLCPPKLLARCPILAVNYEALDLFWKALFSKNAIVSGFYLSPHGLIAFIIGKLTRKKVIISLIAGRAELYTKGSIQGVDFNLTPLPWQGKLFLFVLKHSNAIVTTGSVTKRFLVKHGIKENLVYPIISPVNKSRFYQKQMSRIYDVLSVGSIYLIKHQEVLLQALSELKSKYPNIKACIVGEGPLKSKIIRLSNELNLKENVEFAGFQKDVSQYYNLSKIFVHTSETEGFPNAVLEAMTCGLPCVISNCGDIIDIAKDGFNSLVIQNYSDYRGFANAITNLLEDENLYNQISQNALRSIESIFVEDVTKKWEMIIDAISY